MKLHMMKKNRAVMMLAGVGMVMMLATGCGKEKEEPIPVVLSSEKEDSQENLMQNAEENIMEDSLEKEGSAGENNEADTDGKENGQTGKEEQPQTDNTKGTDNTQADNTQAGQAAGMEELSGNVKSMSQDSFVICKDTTFSDGDGEIGVAPAPGAETADDLVTVYVNPDCSYQYETVRNGGVHPEDISTREGSFGDLRDGLTCIVNGSWQNGSFYADNIRMLEYVR